jgi:subtilisin family serine protease
MPNCNPARRAAGLIWPALLAGALHASADTLAPDLRARLAAAGPDQPIAVIVALAERIDPGQYRSGTRPQRRHALVAALRAQATRSQAPLIALIESQAGAPALSLWATNAIAAELPAAAIQALARHPAVQRIRLDAEVPAPEVTPAATATPEWNLDTVGAPALWALGYDGGGVVVASLDSGVDAAHPDLAPRWRGGANSWYDPNGQHATPYDKTGHGTQTMGLMVGGDAGGSQIGVAPGARWIAVKIFDDAGRGRLSRIHQGFQWLLDPDGDPASDDAPDVVNNSWGLVGPDQCNLEFQADVQLLKAAGIAVVFSAGNDGPSGNTSSSPANNPEGYAVGALDAGNNVAAFSSRGPSACDGTTYPELMAPGVAVRSADRSFGGMANYADVSGTSFAAPHVSGVLALLAQAHPGADVASLEAALVQTARDLGPAGPDPIYGHGLVDGPAAHAALAALPPPENRAPSAGNDAYSVAAGQVLSVAAPGVLANDGDPDGDPLVAQLEFSPGHGSVDLAPGGGFTYTPAPGYAGADSFGYRAWDGRLASNAASVSISVLGNQPPQAANDSASTRRNQATTIAVLANDRDPDGALDPASVAIVAAPNKGGTVAVLADGRVAYTPKTRFTGSETFKYTVRDNAGAVSNSASVTVTVTK